ncbi:MAG: hypothetical protein V4633_17320 [Pseudomonadota bacterium]
MNLPELAWQFAYGRVSWAIVLAALVIGLWPRTRALPRSWLAGLLAGMIVLMCLPGAASPAHWIALGVQYPSGLLSGLCLAKLLTAWQGSARQRMMTPGLAALLAMAGTALYLDAMGLLTAGFYYWGFSPVAAPLAALVLAVMAAAAAARGRWPAHALALALAMLLYGGLRLPTGNLWDALLDPLLWIWALLALARHWWLILRSPAVRPVVPRKRFNN